MFKRFTEQARRVIVLAQEEAVALDHNYIGTEHLLLGLLRAEAAGGARVLESAGITLDAARREVVEIIGRGGEAPSGHVPFTPRAKKVLELSLRESTALGHSHISTRHLLLGLISEGDGVAIVVLNRLGANLNDLREQAAERAPDDPEGEEGQEPPPQADPLTAGQEEPLTAAQADPLTAAREEPLTAAQERPLTAAQVRPLAAQVAALSGVIASRLGRIERRLSAIEARLGLGRFVVDEPPGSTGSQ
jgi:ATP-dependent Clp protease ATP-binding subunit ClpC